jgi:hypothetical protein
MQYRGHDASSKINSKVLNTVNNQKNYDKVNLSNIISQLDFQ